MINWFIKKFTIEQYKANIFPLLMIVLLGFPLFSLMENIKDFIFFGLIFGWMFIISFERNSE